MLDPVQQHLAEMRPEASAALDATIEHRVAVAYADKFIMHDKARLALGHLKQALARPLSERPPGFALIGPSSSGKSAIINRFYRDLGGDPAVSAGVHDNVPILIVKLVARATEPRIQLAIARSQGLPVVSRRDAGLLGDLVSRRLLEKKVRMIIMTQFNHVEPLPKTERKVVYDLLQNISDVGIIVVVVGTEVTMDLILEEEELVTRLRPIRLNGFAKDKALAEFLRTLESYYPLPQPSFLWRDHQDLIFKKTSGILGEVVALVNAAAVWAIRNGHASISTKAFENGDYIPPASGPSVGKP